MSAASAAACASKPQTKAADVSLKQQVADLMSKRSNENIETVYLKYGKDARGISQKDFFRACQEVRLDFENRKDTDELFISMDMNEDGFLDLTEFRRAMGTRSAFEQFILQIVPLHEIISSALPRKSQRSSLEVFKGLTSHEITEMADAVSGVLETVLAEKVLQLRESWEAAQAKEAHDGPSNSKFLVVEWLKAGRIQDYHNGLSGRVGEDLLSKKCISFTVSNLIFGFAHKGVPDLEFEKAMKAEHCTKAGSDFEFETSKKKRKTPRREWEIVVDREPLRSGEDGGGRTIPDIDILMHIPMSVKANLLKIEIIALILYTGPMVSMQSLLDYPKNHSETLIEPAPSTDFDFNTACTVHDLQCDFEKSAAGFI
jgi:hypothetical protein